MVGCLKSSQGIASLLPDSPHADKDTTSMQLHCPSEHAGLPLVAWERQQYHAIAIGWTCPIKGLNNR